jgi:long-chain acyl-CoA synthetase
MPIVESSLNQADVSNGYDGQTSLLVQELLFKNRDAAKLWIVEDNVRWTLANMRDNVFRLGSVLSTKGIQPADRVALLFQNQKEYLAAFFAILHIGAVVVPINSTIPVEDMLYVLKDSGAKLVLSDAVFAPLLEKMPFPVLMTNSPNEVQFPSLEKAIEAGSPTCVGQPPADEKTMRILMYTSGTTGKPKGVMLTEQNLFANLEGVHSVFPLDITQERMLLALPLFHAYGQIIALYAFKCSVPLYLVPNFSPKKIVQVLTEQSITVLPLVPTFYSLILSSVAKLGPEPFKNLKYCVSGGAALPAKLLQKIQDVFPQLTVLEGYGLTETAPVLAVSSMKEGSVPLSVGYPLPNLKIELLDDEGNGLPVVKGSKSPEGEVVASGPNVMLGYYNLPEATKEAFASGHRFKTGDLGHFDEAGHLFISGGRKKDLIIKSGENISPMRIEHSIQEHPAVRDVAVIGLPDEKLGEDVFACVALAPEASGKLDENELKKFLKDRLPPFMMPKAIYFFDELPKNATGKILKPELKKQLLEKSK